MSNKNILKDLLIIYNLLPEGNDKKSLEYVLNLLKVAVGNNRVSLKHILKFVTRKLETAKSEKYTDNSKSIKLWEEIFNIFGRNIK